MTAGGVDVDDDALVDVEVVDAVFLLVFVFLTFGLHSDWSNSKQCFCFRVQLLPMRLSVGERVDLVSVVTYMVVHHHMRCEKVYSCGLVISVTRALPITVLLTCCVSFGSTWLFRWYGVIITISQYGARGRRHDVFGYFSALVENR